MLCLSLRPARRTRSPSPTKRDWSLFVLLLSTLQSWQPHRFITSRVAEQHIAHHCQPLPCSESEPQPWQSVAAQQDQSAINQEEDRVQRFSSEYNHRNHFFFFFSFLVVTCLRGDRMNLAARWTGSDVPWEGRFKCKDKLSHCSPLHCLWVGHNHHHYVKKKKDLQPWEDCQRADTRQRKDHGKANIPQEHSDRRRRRNAIFKTFNRLTNIMI